MNHEAFRGHLFNSDEHFRQGVIRKAVMLGFEAYEYRVSSTTGEKRWAFVLDGRRHDAYPQLYNAALDWLRLNYLTHLI